ncbi:MAG: cystathionine beta-synthase, partial [Polaribacter sp.]
GKNLIPTATNFDVIDIYEKVSDKESAFAARDIVEQEGIFCGYTCGAVLQATKQYNAQNYFTDDSFVVLIFPDHGSRYMNKIYNTEWMKTQGFID